MGKGKRTQIRTEQERIILQEKAIEEKAKKKAKLIRGIIVIASSVIIVAASIFGTLWYSNAEKNGAFLRNKIVFETENYEVNACMMQYYFNSAVNMFLENYSSDIETLGLDTSVSLDEQTCYYDEEMTWHEYFLDSTETQITEILTLCEAARENGFELSETDEKFIEDSVDTLKETAEDNGQTLDEYIDSLYGVKVNLEDIENCIRLTTLASNYYTDYTGKMSYSDAQIEDHFENNKSSYLSVEYLYATVYNNATGEETEAELKKLNKTAKATAKELSDAKDATEFEEKLQDYYEELCRDYYADYTDEEIEAQVETLMTSSEGNASYDVSSETGEWLFSEGRKIGDTTIIENEDGSGYNVYCVTSPAIKNTAATQNVRHILFSVDDYEDAEACHKAAEKLLKKWRNGEKTEDSFAALAKEYSTDQGSASNGGLYENVPEGQMVTEFEDWIFDKSREVGDTDVVDTDYGSHIMYYCGKGYTSWKVNVISDMKDEDYTQKLEDLKEKYKLEVSEDHFELIEFIKTEAEAEEETSSETELTY